MYYVIYYDGSYSVSSAYIRESDAVSAAAWYETLSGVTFVQIVSVPVTVISTWGTAP